MELIRLGRPWSWLYNLAGRLGGRRGARVLGAQVFGGASGPTAVFAAKKRRFRKVPRQNGLVILRLSWPEVFAAARLAALLAAAAALIAALYSHLTSCGRKR